MTPAVAVRTRALRQNLMFVARRMTAELGLTGFTIEQLCDEVGVSRRTFFNHFSSKEDAVVGIELGAADALLEEFRNGGLVPRGMSLVETVCRAALVHVERHGMTREAGLQFKAALDREPSLLPKAMSNGMEQSRLLVDALRDREGLSPDDQRPAVAVAVATAVMQTAAERYFASPDTAADPEDLDTLVLDTLRAATDAVTPTSIPLETTA
ncbi:TetR/AcrR family transcriptional regulator [Curtobacterium sp. RRHDQ10]|jgi:AcrR family transcriptional regulator|uniref:TetR/AcrR family transcriptional regulator n=1 Tax=Curtobacterium phyllosphaerae TaxID=3413379 RepID=UPI003BF4046D